MLTKCTYVQTSQNNVSKVNTPKNKEFSNFEKSMPRKVFLQNQCTDADLAVVQEAQAISLDCSNALPVILTLLAWKMKDLRRSGNGHEAMQCMVGLKSQKEGLRSHYVQLWS